MNTKLSQNAFTLIELLITMALVAALTAFALPSFNKAIVQSRVVDMVGAVAPLKKSIELIIAMKESTNLGASIVTIPATLGPNVANVAVTAATGVITLTGAASAGSVVLVFTPVFNQTHGTVQWSCSTNPANYTLVPLSCQN